MIFIDSNIPMYLVGSAHPHKVDSRRLVEELIGDGQKLVTDAEVLQEILHRYAAINRRDAIQPALDVMQSIADEIYPIDRDDVVRAKDILLGKVYISSRDAIHISVMEHHGVEHILTFDKGFLGYPGITVLAG